MEECSKANSVICFWNLHIDHMIIIWFILYVLFLALTTWLIVALYQEDITSCTCLERPGLKVIFHLYAQWDFFFRSLSSWPAEIIGSYTFENNDMCHPKIVLLQIVSCQEDHLYIEK